MAASLADYENRSLAPLGRSRAVKQGDMKNGERENPEKRFLIVPQKVVGEPRPMKKIRIRPIVFPLFPGLDPCPLDPGDPAFSAGSSFLDTGRNRRGWT